MTTVLSHSHRKTLLMPAHHRSAHGLNASWAIRTRIFLMRTRIFLMRTRIFLMRTCIFLMRTRIFLMRTCIYSFLRTSLPHLTWVNRSTGAHFTLFLLGHKVGRQNILRLRSMLAMHTWICTFSHELHLTRDKQQVNQCVSHRFCDKGIKFMFKSILWRRHSCRPAKNF